MQKSIISTAVALTFVGFSLSSCGKIITIKSDKDNIEHKLDVRGSFDAIESKGVTDVKYVDGPLSVVLSAPEEIIDEISVEVKDGSLVVGMKHEGPLNGRFHSCLTVSAPGVTKFYSYGTGDFEMANLTGKDIVFETYGTGDFEAVSVKCADFKLISAGTGDADIRTLSADFADMSTSGTGDFEIGTIQAGRLKITAGGTGDVEIKSGRVNQADLFNSSTGDIDLRGVSIGNVNRNKNGVGDIEL